MLPYLVRRLLENGANSSFINRLLDSDTDPKWLSENPYKRIKSETKDIPLPKDIYKSRSNSSGMDITERQNLKALKANLKFYETKMVNAVSVYEGRKNLNKASEEVFSISSGQQIGNVVFDEQTQLKECLENNCSNEWSDTKTEQRSEILNKIANDIEENPYELIY